MLMERPNRALAAHDAYEALLELKQVFEDAVKTTHDAELEAFHLATCRGDCNKVRLTLESVAAQLSEVEMRLVGAREKLRFAASA